MKHRTPLILAAAVGVLCAQPLSAQTTPQAMSMPEVHGMGHGGGSMHDGLFMMLLKSANLTPAQHAQIKEILQSEKAQIKPVTRQFHALHEQIADRLLTAGPVSAADLAPLTQKAFRLQQQIDQNMVDTALAIRNVLTPEQISRVSKVHAQLETLHTQIQNLMGSEPGDMAEPEN